MGIVRAVEVRIQKPGSTVVEKAERSKRQDGKTAKPTCWYHARFLRAGSGRGQTDGRTDRQTRQEPSFPQCHAKVAESHRPLCTSHSCTRRETEAVRE